MGYLKKFALTLIVSIVILSVIDAQQVAQKFVIETHYLLSLPEGYENDTTKRWPLLIFLHGSGESGDDLEKVKAHGPPKLVDQGKKFPFIVASPQAPPHKGWQPETLYQLLQHLKTSNRVDNDRIYLTGLSMGGYGTWNLAIEHPEEFAAIAPVCGGGDSSKAWKLRHMPIWNFHGAKDDVVFPLESEKMIAAARKYNSNVRYTLYPEANHNSWDLTYANDSLYTWMLSQSRFRYKAVPVKSSSLKEFAGKYVGNNKDTLTMIIQNDTLVAMIGSESIPFHSAGDDLFFIHADQPLDILFIRNKNKVTSFLLRAGYQEFFRKVK
jgi:predicted esterase